MNRTITIGRESSCDITIDDHYESVSRRHVTIKQRNDHCLVLEDTSTNGTYVNGRKIYRDSTVIYRGDKITLGRDCPLEWKYLMVFFPSLTTTPRVHDYRETVRKSDRPTKLYDRMSDNGRCYEPKSQRHHVSEKDSIDKRELEKWNWGAFALYPLWGFANGMWWLFILAILVSFLSSVSTLFIAPFLGLIVCVCMGVRGSKLAWEKKQWRDFEHYKQVQAQWKPWGIAVFVLNVLVWIIIMANL